MGWRKTLKQYADRVKIVGGECHQAHKTFKRLRDESIEKAAAAERRLDMHDLGRERLWPPVKQAVNNFY